VDTLAPVMRAFGRRAARRDGAADARRRTRSFALSRTNGSLCAERRARPEDCKNTAEAARSSAAKTPAEPELRMGESAPDFAAMAVAVY
jgi:hypothetical protein